MAIISKPTTFSAGTVAVASEVNADFDTIYNDYNGNITNANIAAGAAIAFSKINSAGQIADVDVSSSAAISGSKVSPTFGTQALSAGSCTLNSNVAVAGNITFNGSTITPIAQIVHSSTAAQFSNTNQLIPYDDTIPQNTEGAQYMALTITPKKTTNRLLIHVDAQFADSLGTGQEVILALFQDSTANALKVVWHGVESAGNTSKISSFFHEMAAGTTSATTFKLRAGTESNSTLTFNGVDGARKFGGVVLSGMTIIEYTTIVT